MTDRIHLTRLYERTSAKGNRYMLGRLGYARVVAFQGDPTEDGTPTWNVYLAPVDQQQRSANDGPRERRPSREAVEAASRGRPAPQRRPAGRKPDWPPPREADGLDWEQGDTLPFG